MNLSKISSLIGKPLRQAEVSWQACVSVDECHLCMNHDPLVEEGVCGLTF